MSNPFNTYATDNADFNLTSAVTIFSETNSGSTSRYVVLNIVIGDGVKNLAAAADTILTFQLSNGGILGDSLTRTVPSGQTRARFQTDPIIWTSGEILALTCLSDQAGDTDVDVTVTAYDVAPLQPITSGRTVAIDTSGVIDAQIKGMDTDTLTANALATDAVTEIQSGLSTFDHTTHEVSISGVVFPTNFGDLKITATTGYVSVGSVGVNSVTTPNDFKADISNLATTTNITDARDSIISSGQANWQTATGFSTHSASDVSDLILVNPSNKLLTDPSGYVTAENMRGTDLAYTGVPPTAEEIGSAFLSTVLTKGTTGTIERAFWQILKTQAVVDGTTVANGSNTTSSFYTNLTNADDHFNHMIILFTSNGLEGEARPISTYTQTNGIITLQEPLSALPSGGEDFIILPQHVHPISEIWNYDTRTLTAATNITTDGSGINNTSIASILSGTNTLNSKVTTDRMSKLDVTGTLANSDSADLYKADVSNIILPSSGLDNIVTFPDNFSSLGINPSGDIERVTLVDTTTTNTDMRGTNGANTTTPDNASISAIKAKTDQFTFTNSGNVDATINYVSASSVSSPDDFKNNLDASSVWAYSSRTLTAATNITTDGSGVDNSKINSIFEDTNELQINQDNWLTASGFLTSSALDELKGSGWDSSTDTLEKIRDSISEIDAGTGTGSRSVIIRVNDGTNPIENAKVRLYLGVENYRSITDVNGDTSAFGLNNDGTWNVVVTAPGYSSYVGTLAIIADVAAGDQVYSLTQNVVTPPSDPSYCRVAAYVQYNGQPEQGAVFKATLSGRNVATNGIVVNQKVSATTDSDGYAYLDLIRQDQIVDGTGSYELNLFNSSGRLIFRTNTTIPNSGVVNLEDLI